MGNDEKMWDLSQRANERKVFSSENYQFQSKRRLQKVIETKINTTMIGALSAMEEKFGRLWGQGKQRGQLTEQEAAWLDIKDELRTEILNNGNNQKRAAVAEINQYDVTWKRYHMDLHVAERKAQEGEEIPNVYFRSLVDNEDKNEQN